MDADEVVVPELADEIARRTEADEADGFYLNMKYFFLGRRIRHCGYSEAWNLRLFKHRLGRYERMPVASGGRTGDNEAHEHVELRGRALRLVHELDHHAYPSIAVWVKKHNRYAIWEAEMYERFLREPIPASIGRGKRLKRLLKKVYLRLPFRPLVRFFYSYILRLGFLDGRPGLVFCVLLAFYDFLAWANVYEQKLERAVRRARRPGGPLESGPAGLTNRPGLIYPVSFSIQFRVAVVSVLRTHGSTVRRLGLDPAWRTSWVETQPTSHLCFKSILCNSIANRSRPASGRRSSARGSRGPRPRGNTQPG